MTLKEDIFDCVNIIRNTDGTDESLFKDEADYQSYISNEIAHVDFINRCNGGFVRLSGVNTETRLKIFLGRK